ncbi:hypothetical protein EZS27_029536 [termite gut metagenome]|uniref:Uncharacterized protein n=1 Tax=termite gut metagenome TaxID=433724 RepID=A0A5J4QI59_9ZZZZ
MRDNFIAPLPAEDRVPYWFTDTKLIKSLNQASIMLAKWDIRYVFFAVLFGGRGGCVKGLFLPYFTMDYQLIAVLF